MNVMYIDERQGRHMAAAALTEAVYYILLSLTVPMHGYGIMQNVERLSAGRVKLAAGTLYGAINTMLDKNWITIYMAEGDGRKKEYLITTVGRQVLSDELDRICELYRNGLSVIGGVTNG